MAAPFRHAVATTTQLVADRLADYYRRHVTDNAEKASIPWLISSSKNWKNLANVVQEGEHLEHFHSYRKDDSAEESRSIWSSLHTIDMHVDQGLWIAFTPGHWMTTAKRTDDESSLDSGFFMQMPNGGTVQVNFDDSVDLVIIMLGDGVNQLVNDK